jgi:hypothetical protein
MFSAELGRGVTGWAPQLASLIMAKSLVKHQHANALGLLLKHFYVCGAFSLLSSQYN